MTKVFLDANILIDISDSSRPFSKESAKLFSYLLDNTEKYELFTSCDLLTTIYYVLKRQLQKEIVLEKIKLMNNIIKVIEFGNVEIDEAIYLMEKNKEFTDLEDTIQFVIARKERCDYIISNDKGFYSHEVPLLSSINALNILCP
ncbi:MAG: Ribonuclease [uncultured Sulfurovum sp.]|uniref:Ribonuclease n=1 Tax=uncultured Sulfurovum sp. TaxID=269237 RepID=A0A6S6TIN6_9BACT|nr:MAG: Ribonuclease [uncultured Sulfurovum sp.]